MSKTAKTLMVAAAVLGLGIGAAQAGGNDSGKAAAAGSRAVGNPVTESLTFFNSFDVIQIGVKSTGASLTVGVLDCCIVGDQWQQRTYCLQNGGVWDVRGKGNGLTSGPFTGLSTVYKRGSQDIDCIVEIRYGEGVAIFPAGMDVRFSSPTGTITTTILTTLVPLPSS